MAGARNSVEIADREIDFTFGGDAGLEGHAVGLRDDIAVVMGGEIQTLLFLQRRLEVTGLADQAGLSLLADAALEQWFDEDQLVTGNEILDVVFACIRSQHFGAWEIDVAEKPGSIQHSGHLHVCLLKGCGVDTTKDRRALIDPWAVAPHIRRNLVRRICRIGRTKQFPLAISRAAAA